MDTTSSQPSEAEDTEKIKMKKSRKKIAFPINENWNEQQWRSLCSRCQISLYEIFRSLGIHPPGKEDVKVAQGLWMFEDATLFALSTAVSDVSRTVSSGFETTQALVQAAANPNYLDKEIDMLLDRFGPEFWGQDVDQREGCLVLLIYEDDDDRQLIWLHLHQWIFFKVFNHLRENEKKKGKARKGKKRRGANWTASAKKKAKVKSTAMVYGVAGDGKEDEIGLIYKHSTTRPTEELPLHPGLDLTSDAQAKVAQAGHTAFARMSITHLATNELPVSLQREFPPTFKSKSSIGPPDTPSLVNLCRRHLLSSASDNRDETVLLDRLEQEWTINPTLFCKSPSYHNTLGNVLEVWIEWRRNVLQSKKYLPSLPLNSEPASAQCAKLGNELKKSRLAFMNLKVTLDGRERLSQSILCVMFARVMGLNAGVGLDSYRELSEGLSKLEREAEALEKLGINGTGRFGQAGERAGRVCKDGSAAGRGEGG